MSFSFLSGKTTIRFDRNELSGAFGDIGTDLPLIAGLILVCGLDPASVLIMFGLMQVLSGMVYGLPMPVQPLKAMAVIMISGKLGGNVLYGAGISIGVIMLGLAYSGLLKKIAGIIPESVVRGIQLGLGISLCLLAFKNFLPAEGVPGYLLAGLGIIITLLLFGSRKFPPAIFVVLTGIIYALFFRPESIDIATGFGFSIPLVHVPGGDDILQGLLLLALPQLALSLSNSIISTSQTVKDLFPERDIPVKKIGITYALMNLVNPFFGGIPVCHGAGGMAGHYAFGGRTGGSAIIYGSFYLVTGLFFSAGFEEVLKIFPLPILGVILLFESFMLMSFVRKMSWSIVNFSIAALVALMCVTLPQGYLVGMLAGTVVAYALRWNSREAKKTP